MAGQTGFDILDKAFESPTGKGILIVLALFFTKGLKYLPGIKQLFDLWDYAIRRNKVIDAYTKDSIKQHKLLNNTEELKIHINQITFEETEKTNIFRIILQVKTEVAKIKCLEAIDELTSNNIQSVCNRLIGAIVNEYETKILTLLVNDYGSIRGKQLYDLCYKKHFLPYHSQNISMLAIAVNIMVSNPKYGLYSKYERFIELIDVAIRLAIQDLYKTLREANGKISEIVNKET